jgi:predicted ATPase
MADEGGACVSHDDNVRRLAGKFKADNRYPNFGPIVQSLEIRGFRGVAELALTFESPITAFSGLNGTGKSTIAQLFTCGYRKAVTAALPRYYVKDFFPVSAADPEPFTADAQVVYTYCVEKGADPQRVTVSRKFKEWSGYKRQPERSCYYIGFTQFIPKVERRDLSIYGGRTLELGESKPLSAEAAENVAGILALPYENLDFTEVTHSSRRAELAMATRNGRRYSENHMGFGEGRVVYMVNTMESAPTQSLFVLEEPETSLHGDAQRRLARYLVEVSIRRGHQIILTTHSAAMLSEFGRDSVVYLQRQPDGTIKAATGLSTYQIDSYLHGDPDKKKAVICVEDTFARHLAIEIVRRCDSHLLAGSKVLPIGSAQDISSAVALLRNAGLRAVGLLDGDMPDADTYVNSLPGDQAPEKIVFGDPAVEEHFANDPYSVSIAELLTGVADHHGYLRAIADRLMLEESYVATEACRVYAASHEEDEFASIAEFLRQHLEDRR